MASAAVSTSGAMAPHRDASHQQATTASSKSNSHKKSSTTFNNILTSTPAVVAVCLAGASAFGLTLWKVLRRNKGNNDVSDGKQDKPPCHGVKPTAWCVPFSDGSACVVRRKIPADNSCLFNSVAYVMHHSRQKAEMLRTVVAREVSSDKEYYNAAFLGMDNASYCQWIQAPHNWGGGIELAILSRYYAREIGAWCIDTGRQHVFGEDAGHPKAVMLIYTGSHYDALAIAKNPRAPEEDDKTEFNPRSKVGKMAIEAARKLTQLSLKKGKGGKGGMKGSATQPKQATGGSKPTANGTAPTSMSIKCQECGARPMPTVFVQ